MKKWLIGTVLVLVAVVVLYDVFFTGKGFTLSVQATVRTPTDDPYYVHENGGYMDTWISAEPQAYVSKESHDAPARPILFQNGFLVTGMPYGPLGVRGKISANRLNKACPALELQEDWQFSLGVFNTSDNKKVKMYLDLEIYTDTLKAKAKLYIFYEGTAHPIIYEKDVGIGETFGFGLDV